MRSLFWSVPLTLTLLFVSDTSHAAPVFSATSVSGSSGGCVPRGCGLSASIFSPDFNFSLSDIGISPGDGFRNMGVNSVSIDLTMSITNGYYPPDAPFTGSFEGAFADFYGAIGFKGTPVLLTCPSPTTTGDCRYSTTFTVVAGSTTATLTPDSPVATLLVPGLTTGSFDACLPTGGASICVLRSSPVAGTIGFSLPGTFAVTIGYNQPTNSFSFHETFTTTPEPRSAVLIALALLAVTSYRKRTTRHLD